MVQNFSLMKTQAGRTYLSEFFNIITTSSSSNKGKRGSRKSFECKHCLKKFKQEWKLAFEHLENKCTAAKTGIVGNALYQYKRRLDEIDRQAKAEKEIEEMTIAESDILELTKAIATHLSVHFATSSSMTHRTFKKVLHIASEMKIDDIDKATTRLRLEKAIDIAAEEASEVLIQKLKQENNVSIALDGWTPYNGDELTGVVATSPSGYSYSCQREMDGKDGLYLAQLYYDIIRETLEKMKRSDGVTVINTLVTDEASANLMAKRILALLLPTLIFHKCHAHQVNLIMHDTMAIMKGFRVLVTCQRIAVLMRKSKFRKIVKKEFQKYYPGKKFTAIPVLSATRWNSAYFLLQSVFARKTCLLAAARIWDQQQKKIENKLLLDDKFFEKVGKHGTILYTMVKTSFRMQKLKNSATMADVVESFMDILHVLDKSIGYEIATPKERREAIAMLENRWNELEHPLFLLCLAFHPFKNETLTRIYKDYLKREDLFGKNWTDILQRSVIIYARKFLGYIDENQIVSEFIQWMNQQINGTMNTVYTTDRLGFCSPITYWLGLGSQSFPLLSRLAIRLLSSPVQSSGCETLFSLLGRFLTKYRANLSLEKVEKMNIIRERYSQEQRKGNDFNRKGKMKLKIPKMILIDDDKQKTYRMTKEPCPDFIYLSGLEATRFQTTNYGDRFLYRRDTSSLESQRWTSDGSGEEETSRKSSNNSTPIREVTSKMRETNLEPDEEYISPEVEIEKDEEYFRDWDGQQLQLDEVLYKNMDLKDVIGLLSPFLENSEASRNLVAYKQNKSESNTTSEIDLSRPLEIPFGDKVKPINLSKKEKIANELMWEALNDDEAWKAGYTENLVENPVQKLVRTNGWLQFAQEKKKPAKIREEILHQGLRGYKMPLMPFYRLYYTYLGRAVGLKAKYEGSAPVYDEAMNKLKQGLSGSIKGSAESVEATMKQVESLKQQLKDVLAEKEALEMELKKTKKTYNLRGT